MVKIRTLWSISIKVISFLLTFFLFSCKSNNWEKVEHFTKQYLKDRYAQDFELISKHKASPPGASTTNYSIIFRSTKYPRRDFVVFCTETEPLEIVQDNFPNILLEEAFLNALDIDPYKDFPVVFELESVLVGKQYTSDIVTLEQATSALSSIEKSSWDFFIYLIVEEPQKRVIEIEDMVINLLRQANKILPVIASADVYIYNDNSLTEKDIQPDMTVQKMDRTRQQDKLQEIWSLGWTPTKLKNYPNGFQSVVKKREIIH